MITLSEAKALGSIYHSTRSRAHEPEGVWQNAVAYFHGAYIIAAHTTHSADAEVIGFVSEEEHAEISPLFVSAYNAATVDGRLQALDQLALALKDAVYDELPHPGGPHYGPSPSVELALHEIKNWTVKQIVPGLRQEGDVCFHYDKNAVLSGLHLVGKHPNSKAAIMHWAGHGRSRAHFTDCVIEGLNWGNRSYRIQRERYERVTFRDVPREHGDYCNLSGDLDVDPHDLDKAALLHEHCLFENIAAQAIQTTGAVGKRRLETPEPDVDNVPGGPLVTRECLLRNVSNDKDNAVGGGTSYPISHAYGKHHVHVEEVILDNAMVAEASGFLLVQGQDLGGWKRELEWVGGRVTIRDTVKPVANLQHVAKTYIGGVDFDVDGGQDKLQFTGETGPVVIENCKGLTRIVIGTKDYGRVSDGLHYP